MEITEVRIKLMEESGERLQAFCSITFDNSFVVRDLKIIGGANGPFVAMPSRKLTAHCPQCRSKNHLRAAYCNQCGATLRLERPAVDDEGRAKLYADIAHPINSHCREVIQERVIREYQLEVERAKLPGYRSRYDDLEEDIVIHSPSAPAPHRAATSRGTTPPPDRRAAPRSAESTDAPAAGPHVKPPSPGFTPHAPLPSKHPGGSRPSSEPRDSRDFGVF